jgi:hypothetical protein
VRALLLVVRACMVNASTNRRFGGVLLGALYDTAIHRGLVQHGDALRLTDTRAADLFGIQAPTLGDLKEIRDILAFQRDHPPLGWEIQTYPLGPATNIQIRPHPKPTKARISRQEGNPA